ncbi:MAG: nitroreductase family protein [Actinobacteria bacterium]|nr:MAG: nitroreductase family protein [Actinomycetota bacterium]
MDVYEAIAERRSVRRFQDKDVEQVVLERLLEAAVKAPSAGNLQPWRFIIVRGEDAKHELAVAAGFQRFVEAAPVVLAVGADLSVAGGRYGTRGRELYAIQDTAAAIENLMLAAVAEGLGTCWVGAFDEEMAARTLGCEDSQRVLALLVLGYPADGGGRTRRLGLEHVTRDVR